MRRVAGFLVWAALFAGCVTPSSDPLARMHPYLWPSQGRVEWLTCRWTTEEPVGVAILGTREAETWSVRRALAAWEAVDLGVRFLEVPSDRAQILLVAVDDPVARDDGSRGPGRTITDCRLDESATPRAKLVRSRIEVARAVGPDELGKMHPLNSNEWLGTWVHEIGHALGFQGHRRRGDDPMRLEPDFQRLVGERLRNGKPLVSPALRALYAQPSGTSLGSAAVAETRTRDADEIGRLAKAAGFEGPLLRSGDRAARIFWRGPRGREYGFLVFDLPGVLKRPEKLVLLPEPAARQRLPRHPPR